MPCLIRVFISFHVDESNETISRTLFPFLMAKFRNFGVSFEFTVINLMYSYHRLFFARDVNQFSTWSKKQSSARVKIKLSQNLLKSVNKGRL